MNRALKLTLIFLCSTHLSFAQKSNGEQAKCSYFGEPHLIPFPTASYPIQNQYVCHPNNDEVLISNQFLEINVTTTSIGNYPIIDYTLTIFPAGPFSAPCIITDNINNPPSIPSCPHNSPAIVNGTISSSFHLSHLTENIQVDIDNQGFIDIYITQPVDLIDQSEGVCVKWDCNLEMSPAGRKKRQTKTDSIINKICNIFVDGTRQQVLGEIDENVVKSLQVACEYDISATLDQRYARTIPVAVIRDSAKEYQGTDNYIDYWRKALAAAHKVIGEADIKVNELIALSGSVCKDINGKSQCLQPIDNNDQSR